MIYMDNGATTMVREEVFDAMKPYLMGEYGNPSSIYKLGRNSKSAIEEARKQIANVIGAEPREIFFTGCGTEADNWAIKGVIEFFSNKETPHIITSKVEHHAVLHVAEYLERKGVEVTYLDVDKDGLINIEDLKAAIRPNTRLISIMFANNEIGTIMPIKEIGEVAKANNILFHTDAVQAFGHVPIDVNEMNIDLLSVSGHKVHGPKGVGALYVRKGTRVLPILHGGAQEGKRRPGTENVASIVGFGIAAELAQKEMNEVSAHEIKLRDALIKGILDTIPNTTLNGHNSKRLPNNVNISFSFIEGESLLLMLDFKEVYGSSGSACTSGSLDPSHVLMALGLKHEEAHGSLRLTLSKYNTMDEVDIVVKELKPIVERLRAMSPLYEDFVNGK
ncbi:MAG: cysteine desulfurase NifS [Lachnospirales bacterium]